MKLSDMLFANAMMGEGGGGGGSSDFSTAQVTIIGDGGASGFMLFVIPEITSDSINIAGTIQSDNSATYTIPLYKGKTIFMLASVTYISCTGDIIFDEELQSFVVTGNGTITVRPME